MIFLSFYGFSGLMWYGKFIIASLIYKPTVVKCPCKTSFLSKCVHSIVYASNTFVMFVRGWLFINSPHDTHFNIDLTQAK